MRFLFTFLTVYFFISCSDRSEKIERPRDPWAFRSVLDRKPRMLTLAFDTACYASYDLANASLYKVWKGGVLLEGAAYTDKKNIQPTSWGTDYEKDLHSKWLVMRNGVRDSFRIVNRGYRFEHDQLILKHHLVLPGRDTAVIEELPAFMRNHSNQLSFNRTFTTSNVPADVTIYLHSGTDTFGLTSNSSAVLTIPLKPLPVQQLTHTEGEYDHRGRYWMEKSDCFTCHELDKKTVGPSFREIAGKYGEQENPSMSLIPKVKMGSTGVWGTAVMTPHPNLTETEISVMLDYIFTLRPQKPAMVEQPVTKLADSSNRPGFGRPLESVHPSYDVQTIHNHHFRPRVGGLAFLSDGRLLVTTWDTIGGVYMVENATTGDTNKIRVKRIAAGLAEPLGIEVVNDKIFVLQKQELTQLIDHNNDDIIDEYRTICNSWGVTGDFHEFAFGLVYKEGYFYATLSMAMRLMSNEKQQPDRGRAIKIDMNGNYEWINYGLRTPNGIGLGVDNEIFVTDNQGEWVPANKLIHIKSGEYHGMRWGHLDTTRDVPNVASPAIYLPEDEIGNSPSEPVLINDGIYKGQMLHGDVTYGGIQRDFIEKIDGAYQGCVFRFTQGLEAGVNRMRWGPDGALYIGGVGMVGGWSWKEKQYGLQRLKYNGKPVFDILAMRATPYGFDLEFTAPLADTIEITVDDLIVQQWWYLPTADYGGPKKNLQKLKVTGLKLSGDRKHLSITLPGRKEQRVVYIRLPHTLLSNNGQRLWSGETWYTLNKIPAR